MFQIPDPVTQIHLFQEGKKERQKMNSASSLYCLVRARTIKGGNKVAKLSLCCLK